MKMDRNQVIGFVLLAILLFIYLYISTKNSQELQLQKQHQEDSIANVKRRLDSVASLKDTTARKSTVVADSIITHNQTEELSVVENDVIRITFTNKGGQPKKVELKKYKSYDSTPVVLSGTSFDKFSYNINLPSGGAAQVAEQYFNAPVITKNSDNSQTVQYNLSPGNGEIVTHQFIVRPEDYMIDWNVSLEGADKLLTQGIFSLVWQSRPMQHESDVSYERRQTNICYLTDNDFDYMLAKAERTFDKPVQWVGVAQQFFNTTIYAKNSFNSGDVKWIRGTGDTTSMIAEVTSSLQARLPLGRSASFPMQVYYGPNDYKILRNQPAPQMDKIVNLGRDMYAFVRPINRFVVMPVFNFFKSFIGSYGFVILLLTLFIRLLTSPLVYTSYLSGAKMKALRPEIDKLKQKYGGDQQQIGVEQMKLFREAGVNPLGGCIPALLQIPIFFALYSFFNSNISLRGEHFLWAHNLASYDVLVKFNFTIWQLGNHISLFTITAVITSFLISLYNMNMTPDAGNPAMKYMPYIFPFILLFVFNQLPSALTWYYTVSNLITLALQFVIQNYIIDHDKILAKIDENRKKPKAKSKWSERLEQMQEAQKKMQSEREKGRR